MIRSTQPLEATDPSFRTEDSDVGARLSLPRKRRPDPDPYDTDWTPRYRRLRTEPTRRWRSP
jgi:hypothetical protein